MFLKYFFIYISLSFNILKLIGEMMNNTIERKSNLILHDNPIWKGIIALALPVFLANILKTLHDIVDGIFLGQIPDEAIATSMQSAVALTWPIFFVFISFGMGFSE